MSNFSDYSPITPFYSLSNGHFLYGFTFEVFATYNDTTGGHIFTAKFSRNSTEFYKHIDAERKEVVLNSDLNQAFCEFCQNSILHNVYPKQVLSALKKEYVSRRHRQLSLSL